MVQKMSIKILNSSIWQHCKTSCIKWVDHSERHRGSLACLLFGSFGEVKKKRRAVLAGLKKQEELDGNTSGC